MSYIYYNSFNLHKIPIWTSSIISPFHRGGKWSSASWSDAPKSPELGSGRLGVVILQWLPSSLRAQVRFFQGPCMTSQPHPSTLPLPHLAPGTLVSLQPLPPTSRCLLYLLFLLLGSVQSASSGPPSHDSVVTISLRASWSLKSKTALRPPAGCLVWESHNVHLDVGIEDGHCDFPTLAENCTHTQSSPCPHLLP